MAIVQLFTNPACNSFLSSLYKRSNIHFYTFLEMTECIQNMADVATVYNSVYMQCSYVAVTSSYMSTCYFSAQLVCN